MCVQLDSVSSNLDPKTQHNVGLILDKNETIHAEMETKGIKCRYTDGALDACKYFYKDQNGKSQPLVNEICECSLMEEITGDPD